MFDKTEFKVALLRKDKTNADVAKYLGIEISTLWRKTTGQTEFTRTEIQKICEFLEIEDPMPIFFA